MIRLRNALTLLFATVVLAASPALAMLDDSVLEETENSIGPSIPEPGALVLFAAGTLLVFWVLRRQRATG